MFDIEKHWWGMRMVELGHRVLYCDSGAMGLVVGGSGPVCCRAVRGAMAVCPPALSTTLLPARPPPCPSVPPPADNVVLGDALSAFDGQWDVQGLSDWVGKELQTSREGAAAGLG